ncbi:hypothetical protein Avbf_02017, partial [Armadillidium vulgare]
LNVELSTGLYGNLWAFKKALNSVQSDKKVRTVGEYQLDDITKAFALSSKRGLTVFISYFLDDYKNKNLMSDGSIQCQNGSSNDENL